MPVSKSIDEDLEVYVDDIRKYLVVKLKLLWCNLEAGAGQAWGGRRKKVKSLQTPKTKEAKGQFQ